MNKLVLLSIEDEREVRDALLRDLSPFAAAFRIESAEDIPEAEEVIAECEAEGDTIALLLCDHVLPGEDGIDFLIRYQQATPKGGARKILVTGQAGHEATIQAVNQGRLNYYISKPWNLTELQDVVREELTDYVIEQDLDPLPYVQVLNGPRLLENLSR